VAVLLPVYLAAENDLPGYATGGQYSCLLVVMCEVEVDGLDLGRLSESSRVEQGTVVDVKTRRCM
jgi:hypothetical protein